MAVEIKMPALSPTMEEGKLARWLKKEGDRVKAGDVIDVVEGSRKIEKFAKLTGADAAVVALPSWLSRETGSLKGVVTKLPERSDIDFDVQEHLIVELYSK